MRCLVVKKSLWRIEENGEVANWYGNHVVWKVEGSPDSCGMSNPRLRPAIR